MMGLTPGKARPGQGTVIAYVLVLYSRNVRACIENCLPGSTFHVMCKRVLRQRVAESNAHCFVRLLLCFANFGANYFQDCIRVCVVASF